MRSSMLKLRTLEFQELFDEANRAGFAAGKAAVPAPMVVSEVSGLSNQPKAGGKSWYVSEGPCGFAWVNIRPATSAFAKWMKKKGVATKAYRGGLDIWISEHGQSIARKEAHAGAMAAKLNGQHGITAWAQSRMD